MKSQSEHRISLPEEVTDANIATPRRATGLLAPLSATSDEHKVTQNEIAALLRDADALAPDTVKRSDRPSVEATESKLAVEPTVVSTEAALPKPVDLTGVFRMVPAADTDYPMSNKSQKEEPQPNLASLPTSPFSQQTQPSDQTEGFTKIFRSLSASAAVADSSMVRGSESPTPAEMPREASEPIAMFVSSSPGAKSTDFPEYREGDGSWGEPRYKREQPSGNGAPQMGGGFTQLLRTLSKDLDEPLPQPAMQEPAARSARDLSGPGEFTRIISGSLLREAQGRTPTPVPQAPAEREIPVQEVSASAAISEALLAKAANVASSQPMASPQNLSSQYLPPPPTASQPGIPSAPAAGTPLPFEKLQAYVPLLLVVNVFLMLLVLLALGVVIMRR